MEFFDSHCHLADARFAADVEDVRARARDAGVTHCMIVADSVTETEDILRRFPHAMTTIGVHPHFADTVTAETLAAISLLARENPCIRAIGECGLDTVVSRTSAESQIYAFEAQIQIAKTLRMPLVMHVREAFPQFFASIDRAQYAHGVLHCFTGGSAEARAAIARGLHISISGIVTYEKNADLRAALHDIPLERLLIETDSPYLPPEGKRGERNEPVNVIHCAHTIADELDISIEEIAAQTTQNALRLYVRA